MEQTITIGLDIAKHVFQSHGRMPPAMCCSASVSCDEIASWAVEHRSITPVYDRGAPTVSGLPGSAA